MSICMVCADLYVHLVSCDNAARMYHSTSVPEGKMHKQFIRIYKKHPTLDRNIHLTLLILQHKHNIYVQLHMSWGNTSNHNRKATKRGIRIQ